MSQFLRPDSNITQNSFTNGFAEIDETTASDSDFAWGANNTAAVLEVGTSNPSTPDSGTCTVRYRIAKTNNGTLDGGGNSVTVTGEVYQGTTQIATDSAQTATGTWTDYSFTFNTSAVSDWTDIRLRFTTSASGGSPANRRGGAVSWAEIEIPDAPSGVTVTPGVGAGSWAGLAAVVILNTIVAPGLGSATWTGFAPVAATPVVVSPANGAATWNGFAPTIQVGSGGFDAQRQAIIDGMVSAQSEANGWNAERSNIPVTAVARTSDTVVTITLPALSGYDITAPETLTVTVPGAALTTGAAIVATPTVEIAADSDVVPGVGSATWQGFAPALDLQIVPSAGLATWTGLAPTISTPVVVAPGLGQATWTGFAPGVTGGQGLTVATGLGQGTWSGLAPTATPSQNVTVTPATGQATWTGLAPVVSASQHITVIPGVGQGLWTGLAPVVVTPVSVTPEPGTGIWAGFAPSPTVTPTVPPVTINRLIAILGASRNNATASHSIGTVTIEPAPVVTVDSSASVITIGPSRTIVEEV